MTQAGGGVLELAPGGQSAPNALRMTLSGSGTRKAYLERTFTIAKSARCAVSVRVDQALPSSEDVQILALASTTGAGLLYLKLSGAAPSGRVGVTYHADAELPDGGTISQQEDFATLPLGVFVRVELGADGTAARVSVDGVASTYPFASAGALPVDLHVQLGETEDRENGAMAVAFDDLACQID